MIKKKVYRIVLEWVTNHFNDFEASRDLYDFLERFQEQLGKEKMYEQFRVLSIAISTKSKQRTITLARSKRDEPLMFSIQGSFCSFLKNDLNVLFFQTLLVTENIILRRE